MGMIIAQHSFSLPKLPYYYFSLRPRFWGFVSGFGPKIQIQIQG
jgi:hypothetical protein